MMLWAVAATAAAVVLCRKLRFERGVSGELVVFYRELNDEFEAYRETRA